LNDSLTPESPLASAVRTVSAADVTGEFPVQNVTEESSGG
jgi:hypothetical protein